MPHPIKAEAYPLEVRERGYQLYRKGHTHSEISESLGIKMSTLVAWSSRNKWKHRLAAESGQYDAGAPTSEPKSQVSDSPLDERSFTDKQSKYRETMATQAVRIAETVATMGSDELVRNADKIKSLDAIARKALDLESSKPSTVINVSLLAKTSDRREELPVIEAEIVHNLPSLEDVTS